MLARNDFANAAISRLTQLGAKVLPRYDELSFCFFVDVSAAAATGKKGYLRLEQWYDRYQEALLDGRGGQAIDDLARYWMQLLTHSQSHTLDTSKILPLVRSRFDFVVESLRAGADGHAALAAMSRLALKPLTEHLVVVLAEDSTNAWHHVTHDQLSHAGLTWESALDLALKNLCRAEPGLARQPHFISSEGNTWVPATRQSPHTAATLLFPDLCRSLPVAGQRIAFAPFANTLAITGSGNHAELARLAATTLSLLQTKPDKPLFAIPLVLDGNQWRPWLPPQSHPVYAAIRELWVLHENSLYAEQGKLLRQQYEGKDDAPYVASYKVMAMTAPSGPRSMNTVTVWTQSLRTLLPKADAVVLTQLLNKGELDAGKDVEPWLGERITVAWQDLANYLGDKLQPQGMYPERYLVTGDAFPTGSDWDGLALAQGTIPPPAATPTLVATIPPAIVSPPSSLPTPAPVMPAARRPSPPQCQPPIPLSKIPVAPPQRPPLWPVLLAVAIPVGLLFVLCLGVGVVIFSHWTSAPAPIADQGGQMPSGFPAPRPAFNPPRAGFGPPPPGDIQPPDPRKPQYIVKLPWTDIGPFAALPQPEAPLPKFAIDQDDLLLAGRPLTERLNTFRDQVPEGGWLVGLRIVRSFNWNGAIQSLQPIYQVEDKYELGKLCGSPGGAAQTEVLAKPGFAIGKIEARAGLVTNAVRLTICRVTEQGLDVNDSYTTQWLGSEGGGEMAPIGGRGEIIVGLAGTFHPNHDLIELQGLVTMPLPKVEQPLPKSAGIARSGASTPERRGGSFSDQAPDGGWLVGLRVFQGESWRGAPLAIQPIYQVEDKYLLGSRLGKDGGELHQWIAPPGYAVGEIWADQGLIVHRLRLRYQKVGNQALEASDSNDSPGLGPDGGQQYCLSSEGRPIVGLNAELAGDIRSLGIIVAGK